MLGEIIKSEIIVAGQRRLLGSRVPVGETLAVGLTVENKSTIPIEMGVYWQLLDPSNPVPYGAVRQEWNSPYHLVAPGGSPVFDGPDLTVDVEGTWSIWAQLWGREPGGEWEVLDEGQTPLCRVGPVPAGCAAVPVVAALCVVALAVAAFLLGA